MSGTSLPGTTNNAKTSSIRLILWASSAILIIFVLWCSAMNEEGLKYSSVRKQRQNALSLHTSCTKLILELHTVDSWICCDANKHHSDMWVCRAAFDPWTRWFSSTWALFIPLLPILFTSFIRSASSICFSVFSCNKLTNNNSNRTVALEKIIRINWSIPLKRAIAVLFFILIRTVFLYLLPLFIEDQVARSSAPNGSSCWCPDVVSTKKCELKFDYSDHVVLFVAQYIFPSILELLYLAFYDELSTVGYALSMAPWLLRLTMLVPAAIIVLSLRAMMFTMLFFHTPMENILALMICLIFPILPICTDYGIKAIEKLFV
jgi:hypothetical protein